MILERPPAPFDMILRRLPAKFANQEVFLRPCECLDRQSAADGQSPNREKLGPPRDTDER